MSRKALAPVAAIATEARRINDRNLDIRLPIAATRDEISHLSERSIRCWGGVESGVRSIRDFTANAAHELRTPLALIRTEVEVALSRMRTAEEYREACEQVQLQSVRMTGLIDSLLMLARVDAGTETLCSELVDANQLARQVEDKWKNSMRLALLEFTLHTEPGEVFISADRSSLQRLLTILLDNAVRYTPPGGFVILRVSRHDGNVVFTVHDSGIGIAPEDTARVFERFYRVERTRGAASGGSGLGLAIANWIAEKHQTFISLESKLGKGSHFQIAFRQAVIPFSLIYDPSQYAAEKH
jgi:signal transduction histidine kinase